MPGTFNSSLWTCYAFLVIRASVLIGLVAWCILVAGCDSDRIARLERENAELKSKAEGQNLIADYDLRAKCGRDSRTWFNENYAKDRDTVLLTFTDHYSAKLNKCFVLVEYHYNSRLAGPGGDSWTNDMAVFDVYENENYARFDENHYTYLKPKFSTGTEVISCVVRSTQCKTGDEFNGLLGPLMAE